LIFEINPNKYTTPFITPLPKCTNTQINSGCVFIIAEAKQKKALRKIKRRWQMNDKEKKHTIHKYLQARVVC